MKNITITKRGLLFVFIISFLVSVYSVFAQVEIPSSAQRGNPSYVETVLTENITPSSCIDSDSDGYYVSDPDAGCEPTWADCDDTRPDIYRAFDGSCDKDNDNHIDISAYSDQKDINADCDDEDNGVYRGNSEIYYDGKDNDCSASLSDPDQTPDDDIDQDGYGIVYDCNDRSNAQNPEKNEIPSNGIDDNCDGLIDENIPQNADAFRVSDPDSFSDIGRIFSQDLPNNINEVLSSTHAPYDTSSGLVSRPFDAMSVGLKNEVIIHPNKDGELAIKNDESVGAVLYNKSGSSEEAYSLGISAKNVGLSGVATSDSKNSSGIVIDTYDTVIPQIGLYSLSDVVGTYAESMNDLSAGTFSDGADVGHFASGLISGLVGEGSYYGLYGKSRSGYGVIGLISEGGSQIFGALGVDGYGLYTGFDASSKNLNVSGTTSAYELSTNVLSVDSSSSARFMKNLNVDSIVSYLQVEKPLVISGYLRVWGNLTLSGSLTINNGFLRVDSSISTPNSEVLYFTGATYISGNLEALANGASISASESIGDFYTLQATGTGYAQVECKRQDDWKLCSEGEIEYCSFVYDPLVSCSAQSADGSYVGARPKKSTDSICEAYSADENASITVTADCFNPLGPVELPMELPPDFDPTRYIQIPS